MRKIIFVIVLLFTANLYAQEAIQSAKMIQATDKVSLQKDKPVDARLLYPDLDKEANEYMKNHPEYSLTGRLNKPAWTFAVGSTYTWKAYNFKTTLFDQIASTCRAVGTHCYIFVEDASYGTKVTDAAVTAIQNAFDSSTPANASKGIFTTNVETFGAPPDVDGDSKIIILILDIKDSYTSSGDSYTVGFFHGVNELPKSENSNSNLAEIYYLDCNPLDLTTTDGQTTGMATAAHEFQHMIHYSYQHGAQTTFLNEGCSLVAELINGYDFREQTSFASDTPQALFGWRSGNDALKDYSRAARFMLYYYNQFGTDFLTKFVQSAYNGVTGINDALSKLTVSTSRRFADILPDWYIANAIDNTSVDSKWGYTLVTGMAKPTGTTYWNANVSSTTLTVPGYGAQIITHKGSLSLNALMSGGNATYGSVKVIKNSSTTSTVANGSFGAASTVDPLSPAYNSVQYLVLNSGTSDYSFQYSASGTNPTTPYEFMYDNETTSYYVAMPAGAKHAVIFEPALGCTLSSVQVYMRNANNSLTMEIYTYSGTRSAPLGTKLLNAITVTNPNTTAGWVAVPLTSYNLSPTASFIVVFTLPVQVVSGGTANTVRINLLDGIVFSNSLFSEDGTNFVWYVSTSSNVTYVNKIRAYALTNTTTGTEEVELLPTEFSVSQNYPNPFNPSTKIKFTLPETARVTVRIYDMLGREIRTLVNTEHSAGTHEVMWNGDNDMGQKVASGIYMYAVSTNKFVQTKKMVLLK